MRVVKQKEEKIMETLALAALVAPMDTLTATICAEMNRHSPEPLDSRVMQTFAPLTDIERDLIAERIEIISGALC